MTLAISFDLAPQLKQCLHGARAAVGFIQLPFNTMNCMQYRRVIAAAEYSTDRWQAMAGHRFCEIATELPRPHKRLMPLLADQFPIGIFEVMSDYEPDRFDADIARTLGRIPIKP